MTIIRINCKAKTEDSYREIRIDSDGRSAVCSCNLYADGAFCAHIDAVLIAGERFMVRESDRPKADKAMKMLAGTLTAPRDWKASWRKNMRWRGLTKPGERTVVDHSLQHGDDYYARPTICFTGKGPMPRASLLEHARNAGWQAVDTAVAGLRVLVAEDPSLETSKLKAARAKNIPIISYEEYLSLSTEGELNI